MNFLKGSLFRRNTEPEELEPMEESGGGILAVWGSPGCGKTVTAVKIAKHLAAQKKNTVLLLCDMTAPMMPCICPPSELEVDKSLGSIFAAQHISVNLIKHNLTTLKRLPHLTMLGLRKKENEYTYAPCTKQQAEELIRGLRKIVPYVVIDCSSYIANDILSAVALMEADSVLQLASCDLKSVGYLSSQLPLLGELKWDKDKQYRVASNIKPFQAADRIGQVLGMMMCTTLCGRAMPQAGIRTAQADGMRAWIPAMCTVSWHQRLDWRTPAADIRKSQTETWNIPSLA